MDEGEDFVSYVSVPSLKNAAMTRIVTELWELQCCILKTTDFPEMLYPDEDDDEVEDMVVIRGFTGIEKKVLNNLPVLGLPKQLEQQIVRYVRPIGNHLLNWLDPENFSSLSRRTIGHIHWTNEGTINVSETIRVIFNENSKDQAMFMTLSNACLEDLVKEVWCNLPEHVKDINSLHNKELSKMHQYYHHLVMYWICFCKDELSNLIETIKKEDDFDLYERDRSIFENMFDLSIWTRNKLAAKYFWQKLTEEEKHKNTMKWITNLIENDVEYFETEDGFFDIFLFLLGEMNDCEQKKQIFQKYSKEILKRMLFGWPWQKYFFHTISAMFPFLEESVYVELMTKIVSSIRKGRMIEKIFEEVWYASPVHLKTCFLKDAMKTKRKFHRSIFHDLFDRGDTDIMRMILNYAPETDRKKFMSWFVQSDDFIEHIAADSGDFSVDNFLRGILSSESDVLECKELLNTCHMNNDCFGSSDYSGEGYYDSDFEDTLEYMHYNAMAELRDFQLFWY